MRVCVVRRIDIFQKINNNKPKAKSRVAQKNRRKHNYLYDFFHPARAPFDVYTRNREGPNYYCCMLETVCTR